MRDGTDLRDVDVHGDGSLDHVKRNDDPELALVPLQYPLEARERTSGNAHPPANGQERVRNGAKVPAKPGAEDLHLIVSKCSGQSVETHQPHDTGNLQDAQPFRKGKPHKNVTRKERKLQFHATVFPATHRVVEREKMLDRSPTQIRSHSLLMVGAGIGSVPMRSYERG
jgi:hypothetical protein